MSERVVGEFKLMRFSLSNGNAERDIMDFVESFSIKESIHEGYISGSAAIVDATNLPQNFPIQGQEVVTIEYEDYFGKVNKEQYFLYSLQHDEMLFNENDQKQTYTIFFCSIPKLIAATKSVQRAFEGPVSEAANNLFQEYFSELDVFSDEPKEIEVEPTDGLQRLAIPSYDPIEAMHFLSRNSYTSARSSAFKFFETREKYFFATPEFFIEKYMEESAAAKDMFEQRMFFTTSEPEALPGNVNVKMAQILGLKFGTRVNTISDLNNNTYARKVVELDVNHREVTATSYRFPQDMYQYFPDTELFPRHDESFIESLFKDEPEYFTIKDWTLKPGAMRPNPEHPTIVGPKAMQLHQESANQIEIHIHGRNTINAGTVIDLTIPKFEQRNSVEKDEERSGWYFVVSVNNEFIGNTYRQSLVLARPGNTESLSNNNWPQIPEPKGESNISTESYYGPF